MNKLYDIIIREYNKYLEYDKFFKKEEKNLESFRKNILEQQLKIESDVISEEDEDKFFNNIIQKRIYAQDLQMLYYNLYTLTKAYQELDDVIALPKELLKMCEEYEHIVPKTIYVLQNEVAEERVKGMVETIRKAWKDRGTIKLLKTELEQEINKLKNASE